MSLSPSVKGGIPVKDKTSMLVDGDHIAIAVEALPPDPKDAHQYRRAQILAMTVSPLMVIAGCR